jgi:hypothetical protein
MATPINIVSDVGTLLRVPTKVSTELVDKACLCIGSAISEAKRRGDTQMTVSIGIGNLSINLVDMECKFVPGKNLKAAIKQSLTIQGDPLELALEQTFADKLLAICEEVI